MLQASGTEVYGHEVLWKTCSSAPQSLPPSELALGVRRKKFDLASVLTYQFCVGQAPSYLAELVTPYHSNRSLYLKMLVYLSSSESLEVEWGPRI